MIKLRLKDGTRVKVPEEVAFIEICDREGKLAMIINLTQDNKISTAMSGDKMFDRYASAYRASVTNLIR